MTANDLLELGFKSVDENEFTNGDYTIFLISDTKISILGEDEFDFLSIPTLLCSTKKEFINFFKMVGYDIQSKN